ncbi:hypothetical protein AYI68_g6102 [Smittium mucronatum]|uniref:Uncharacterized protein n=1 Tax=Smittium mucronatum TaxID=133383 RepID=A0A1R0GSD7_9FUNG|nr:hypothetical protein AYI68_g6102 [Smittium mucronatum]
MSFIKWQRGCHRPSRPESPWTGNNKATSPLVDDTRDSQLRSLSKIICNYYYLQNKAKESPGIGYSDSFLFNDGRSGAGIRLVSMIISARMNPESGHLNPDF